MAANKPLPGTENPTNDTSVQDAGTPVSPAAAVGNQTPQEQLGGAETENMGTQAAQDGADQVEPKTDEEKATTDAVNKENGTLATTPETGVNADDEANAAEQERLQDLQNTPGNQPNNEAPASTEPDEVNIADGQKLEDAPHPHLDNTDVQDEQNKVNPLGESNIREGADASVPATDKAADPESKLDLKGIRAALVTARNKVVEATNHGVKLTREEFDDHSEVTQLAAEISQSLGNLR